MTEKLIDWLWLRWRKKSRQELDRIEQSLVIGRHERRPFAGDPNQLEHQKIQVRKKPA